MTWHFPLIKPVSFTFFETRELLIFKSSHFRESLAMLKDLTCPLSCRFLSYTWHFCVCMYICMFASVWAGTRAHSMHVETRGWSPVSLNPFPPYPVRKGLSLNACIWLVLAAVLLLGFPASALLWWDYGEAATPAWHLCGFWGICVGLGDLVLLLYGKHLTHFVLSSAPRVMFWRET